MPPECGLEELRISDDPNPELIANLGERALEITGVVLPWPAGGEAAASQKHPHQIG